MVRSFFPCQMAIGKERKKDHLLDSYFLINTDSATHSWVLWSSFYRWVYWRLEVVALRHTVSYCQCWDLTTGQSPPEPMLASLGTWLNTELTTTWRDPLLLSSTAKDHPLPGQSTAVCVWERRKDGTWAELKMGHQLCAYSPCLLSWVLDIILELQNFASIVPKLGLKNTYFQLDTDFPRTLGVH